MLTKIQLEAIYQRLTVNTEAIDRLLIRANAHAEDITELTRRIEKLENYAFERIGELDEAALELARVIRRLTERIEQLERLLERGD